MKILFLTFFLFFTCASAIAWTCQASSPSSKGKGVSPFLAEARLNALNACQFNTPVGELCKIDWCVE